MNDSTCNFCSEEYDEVYLCSNIETRKVELICNECSECMDDLCYCEGVVVASATWYMKNGQITFK